MAGKGGTFSDSGSSGSGGGGGTPGSPSLSIQGNSGGSFVGIPNSSFDATTGDVTLDATLNINSAATKNGLIIQSTGDEDIAAFGVKSDASGTPGVWPSPAIIQGDGAGSAQIHVLTVNGSLAGAVTGSVGLQPIVVNKGEDWTSGNPVIDIGITVESGGSPPGFPAQSVAGILVNDQNEYAEPGTSVQAGLYINDQTAPGLAIKTGLGPVSLGDTTTAPNLSSNFTATANADSTIPLQKSVILATGGTLGITLSMPTLVAGLPPITVKKVDSGVGSVTISGTIDGDAGGYVLTNQYQFVTLATDGSSIYVIGKN